ncbi:MAG TPA: nuclear transport factor 2 family protein [Aeromicrobium sp.]|nr:nuclear transport factor 2 family protein [Aeromicrobium sp.]
MDLQQISDRLQISDVVTGYTRAVDLREWDRLDDVFTADARIDYTSTGGSAGTRDEIKAWLAQTLPLFFSDWLHLVGQLDVTFDGPDAADVSAYFTNPMTLTNGEPVEVAGIYHHRMVRTPVGWLSEQLIEQKVWSRGL